ncbi:putative fatty acyl-CoA reductase CG5065 [Amblyomma americanum]
MVNQPQLSSRLAVGAGEQQDSRVAQFYHGRVLFITGGTGFIGKVLVEKLLRSCPGVKRVYLLVRSKRGEEPVARLRTALNSEVFDRVRQEQPAALEKVRAIAGDLALPNLGLSDADQTSLIEEVSVVFHSAATVRFYDPLKRAVAFNVLGTRCVLELCRKMPKLCAFVHVSTAYSNWSKNEVHEMIYPSPVDAQRLIEATQCVDEKIAEKMSEFSIGQPNNYALTKAVAESLVLDERGTLPVAIVRPSIVTASWKEPFPGWVDNLNGCTGIMVSLGLGLLPSAIAKEECLADLVPVDIVANMLICVAWHTNTTRPEHIRVYNCTRSNFQPRTWGEVLDELRRIVPIYPLPDTMFYPSFLVTENQLLHRLLLLCLRYVPARTADLALQLTGRQPRFVALYEKVYKGIDAVKFFTTNSWLFRSSNVVGLINDLSATDKQLFNIDLRNMEWTSYCDNYVLGARKYLFKAKENELPQARKRLRRLYAAHIFVNFFLAIAVFGLLVVMWLNCCVS